MEQNDRERQLLLVLQSLIRASRSNRGMITEQQLQKALGGLDLDDSQQKMVREYLRSNDVGIDEPVDFDLKLSDEEKDYLAEYSDAVRAIPQPTDGEKDAVKILAMAGDRGAQKKLAEYMLPDVVDIARLYAGQGVYMEDLIGAGNEALVRGTMLLGPLEGPQDVEPALAERIMNAMEDLIAEGLDTWSVDQSAADEANRVMEHAQELAELLGRKVTVEELAAEGDVTEEEIRRAIRNTGDKIEAIDNKADS